MAEKEKDRQDIWAKILNIDVRVLYWACLFILALPLVFPFTLPIVVTEPTRAAYNTIQSLPEGSVVLYYMEAGVGGWPELMGSMVASMKHIYARHLKFVIVNIGYSIDHKLTFDRIFSMTGDPSTRGYKYGEDWAYFGFASGMETAVASLAQNFRSVYREDNFGKPIDQLPIMRNVNEARDFKLVLCFNTAGGQSWIRAHWTVANKVPSIIAVIGAALAQSQSDFKAGMNSGFWFSVRGAAEYEGLLKAPGIASARMSALDVMQLVTILMVIVANGAFLMSRRRKK